MTLRVQLLTERRPWRKRKSPTRPSRTTTLSMSPGRSTSDQRPRSPSWRSWHATLNSSPPSRSWTIPCWSVFTTRSCLWRRLTWVMRSAMTRPARPPPSARPTSMAAIRRGEPTRTKRTICRLARARRRPMRANSICPVQRRLAVRSLPTPQRSEYSEFLQWQVRLRDSYSFL